MKYSVSHEFGLYTLGNDVVYDQIVALVNSIRCNVDPDIPICIVPYDDKIQRLTDYVNRTENVTLFADREAIARWENFADRTWAAHPQAAQNAKIIGVRKRAQRRYVAFEGPFEKFVYYDADSLAMKPLDSLFAKLAEFDFVFDDWEPRKPDAVAALRLDRIRDSGIYSVEAVRPLFHCSSFFGARRGLFDAATLQKMADLLIDRREIEWIPAIAEAFMFTYLTLRAGYSQFNFTQDGKSEEVTGNCADADPFVEVDRILYNADGHKRIHRIHYMNFSSKSFARLCDGEDVGIPFQKMFLHYRFLNEPEKQNLELKHPSFGVKVRRKIDVLSKKIRSKILR